MNIIWLLLGLGIFAILMFTGQPKNDTPKTPSTPSTPADEDPRVKENSHYVAVQLADQGGMLGIMARNWLAAYEEDPTVPPFGMRPYWTPTGPGGAPQFLSSMGNQGIGRRLAYVRQAEVNDSLLPLMVNDASRRVREAAQARLTANRTGSR